MLDHLPHPIFLEILYRVPVKSLIKCTSVSKTWYSLIKSSEFIYAHLKSSISRNIEDPYLVSLREDENMDISINFETIESNQRYRNKLFNIPQVISPLQYNVWNPRQYNVWLIGYANGLLCFAISPKNRSYYYYLLWNPSIHKYFTLPQANYEHHEIAAFMFDSNVNDYYLLAVRRYFEVELYSLRNHSWKIISVDLNLFYMNLTFVEGVIYFVGFERDGNVKNKCIFGLNLADEFLHKILVPESLEDCDDMKLFQNGNNSIAVMAYYEDKMELWFIEEISGSGIWKKVLDTDRNYIYIVFGVWKGCLLFEHASGHVISLDLNCLKHKNVGLFQDDQVIYHSMHGYVETLALLDNGKDVSILEEDVGIWVNSSDSD